MLVYIFFVFFIGMTLMMSEFVIGRRTKQGPLRAFSQLRPDRKGWRYVGLFGLITCFLILAVYLVISGWTLNYFWESLTGSLAAIANDGFETHFNAFASSWIPVVFIVIFILLNVVVVIGGVEEGIERISKLLMPILLVLILVMCVRSLTLDGASAGLAYLFNPDFSKLTGEGILAALGQALFSLSVGMGVMVMYGSYLPVDDNILKSSIWISVCDFLIAILSGVAIFPAVFACGQEPTAGPGLVYQVLPVVFNSMGGVGRLFSVIFFILLSLAALTSSISLFETLTKWFAVKRLNRTGAAFAVAAFMLVLASMAALSFGEGPLSGARLLGRGLFDFLDILTGTLLPPLCALLTIIFFGWVMRKEDIRDELSNHGTVKVSYFNVFYYFLARIVAPAALVIVLITGIIGLL